MNPVEKRSGYSSFSHLVDALFLEPQVLMAALTAYFDESVSGNGDGFLVVAGYIATVERWKCFDEKWSQVLASYGIEKYFHSKEFIHSIEQFAQWKGNETKRLEFIKELIAITIEYVLHGFSCGVSIAAWDRADTIYKLHESYYQPFALCGWHCIGETLQWAAKETPSRQEKDIEFIFEAGSQSWEKLRLLSENLGIIPIQRKKRDVSSETRFDTPLQAADFAAWQFSLHFNKLLDVSSEPALNNSLQITYLNRRKDLIPLLDNITYEHYLYTYDDLIVLCQQQRIERRL